MIFLITVNNKHICNVAVINALSNVVTCKAFVSIVVLLLRANSFLCLLLASLATNKRSSLFWLFFVRFPQVVLELNDVIETDAGLYKVKAKNKFGEVAASINLNFSREYF
jgi:hypothetical protein